MTEDLDEYRRHVETINYMLSRLLEEIRPVMIPDRAEWVDELIDVGEPLLALETLIDGLELAECVIERAMVERLKEVAKIMSVDDDSLFSLIEKQVRE